MKKIGIISVLVVFTLSVAGVITVFTINENNDDVDEKKPTYNVEIGDNESTVIESMNSFTIDFYKELLSDNTDNMFYSGYSIFTALSMTYEGAKDETASDMKNVLKIVNNNETVHNAFKNIYYLLNQNDEYSLSTANALWIKQDYQLLQSYLDIIQNYYMGEANKLDFSNPSEAADTINTWVEQQTNDKIKDLVPVSAINDLTRLILTNAIYFKGNWQFQFDIEDTYDREFTKNDGTKIQVPTMNMYDPDKRFNYTDTGDMQILEMSYAGDELSMVILLPEENDIAGLENKLIYENLKTWISQLQPTKLDDIHIPRFKMETSYDLNKYLKNMGMINPFATSADFSGINGIKELFISAVLHKAFVEVNEEGTEAAAATAVIMAATSANPQYKLVFDADHPFIFLIREKDSGLILFTGKVMEPME